MTPPPSHNSGGKLTNLFFRFRPHIEICGIIIAAGGMLFTLYLYTGMLDVYKKQLLQAEIQNSMHAKERAEDNERIIASEKRAADENKRKNDENQRANREAQRANQEAQRANLEAQRAAELQRKVQDAKTQLTNIKDNFVNSFDDSITSARKQINNTTTLPQLRILADDILKKRKDLRDHVQAVQENMSIIFMAVDSTIDELDREINHTERPNPTRVRELFDVIFNGKDGIANRVTNAVGISLNAMGCTVTAVGALN